MKWFEIWFADKKSMVETMVRNMAADLACGYDYFGSCITRQREEIAAYQKKFDAEMDHLKEIGDDKKVDRWCYYDLCKRGVIA